MRDDEFGAAENPSVIEAGKRDKRPLYPFTASRRKARIYAP